jgi:flagellar biosynthesis/type III secretory pathway chaperone
MSTRSEQVVDKAAPDHIDVRAVITVTARLAQLLAEEVDLLSDMKVSKIEHLQSEKIFLTNALEAQKKLINKHPHLAETIPSQDREDLAQVVEVFEGILEENHRKLLLAKEINHQVVQAITSVVKDKSRSKVYDDRGHTGVAAYETLSVTLNQTV